MKKHFLHVAAMAAASVLSFCLCGSAVSASADAKTAMEAVPAETYSFLRAQGYSNAQILVMSEVEKEANSYLAEYKVSGLKVGETYELYLYVEFSDDIQFYRTYETDTKSFPDTDSVMVRRKFTATASTMTFATLAFYWKEPDGSFSKNIQSATIVDPSQNRKFTLYTTYACSGDVDNTYTISQTDLTLLLQYLNGSLSFETSLERKRADVDMNGSLELQDAILIDKYIAATDNRSIWGDI